MSETLHSNPVVAEIAKQVEFNYRILYGDNWKKYLDKDLAEALREDLKNRMAGFWKDESDRLEFKNDNNKH